MFMERNVPGWERIVRIVTGLVAAGFGLWWMVSGALVGVVVIASGLGFAATGVVGWCPLCAMVGRTLPKTDHVVKVAKY